MDNQPQHSPDTHLQQQHQLVLAIAGELARMEQNLALMSPDTRGHKQLSRSVQRMANHLRAAGYEVQTLLGSEYADGMNVVATFSFDEAIPPGRQLITASAQPQVHYNGELLQVAHVTVSQNPLFP